MNLYRGESDQNLWRHLQKPPHRKRKASRSRSLSRLLWQSLGLGLVLKFEPGLGLSLRGYGLEYITAKCLLGLNPNFRH